MKKNSWHLIKITEEEYNNSKHLEVLRRFVPHLDAIGRGVALFKTPFPSKEYKIYISPSDSPYIRSLIEDFKALPCDPPSASEAEYYEGDREVKI